MTLYSLGGVGPRLSFANFGVPPTAVNAPTDALSKPLQPDSLPSQIQADDYRTPNPFIDVLSYRLALDLRGLIRAHSAEGETVCNETDIQTVDGDIDGVD